MNVIKGPYQFPLKYFSNSCHLIKYPILNKKVLYGNTNSNKRSFNTFLANQKQIIKIVTLYATILVNYLMVLSSILANADQLKIDYFQKITSPLCDSSQPFFIITTSQIIKTEQKEINPK
ncbi:hypothetical protein ABPG72_003088 [Tetrahymena utriculariae]